MDLTIGQRVYHEEHGEGVIISLSSNGFVLVFFSTGERSVSLSTLSPLLSRSETIIKNIKPGKDRAKRSWLTYQAYKLPLLQSAATLTSARIDLLPHQVVLTHRIATASPRRFLIADEVGLGKTIETALILRELASRGELNRALMIVPAGLVNNWHRELNEVFNLNFEVFGSEGDVTDRRSNAFAKHNLLIASIDTLKRKTRLKKLKEAPLWDLVVFDEAHHLTAYRSGGRIKKTENYKLAEVMRDISRDLILLSATPHQGDNFRFWMLVQLLNPGLFRNVDEMLTHRHRLNEIVFRRTKADACRPDGSTLFARRFVQTESFIMSDSERDFYGELIEYLADGFALAKRQGSKGHALGFVMTIFQKIAASSFAAVRRTLRRRLLALTVQEGLMYDNNLEINAREQTFAQAREMIREEYGLGDNRMADIEIDHIFAEYKRKIARKMDEEASRTVSDEKTNEIDLNIAEDMVIGSVAVALPEERYRIQKLLQSFPHGLETKVQKLLHALGVLWRNNSDEKIVIFATYLGTVEMLEEEIERQFPGQGVTVLKGGDHGAKVASEKRFRRTDGPKVLISTAAGREGINLQFARILFNFDLPWNPMDVEQRIGRIHRYGQKHTAQVYNLVLSDTIEGKIYLLLDEKLKEIARTLGKVDEFGNVAEDLQSQILGQLSERLNYDSLYKNALEDPELKRTKYELEVALSNSLEARKAVTELFQDLESFSLDEYTPFANVESDMQQLEAFIREAVTIDGGQFIMRGEQLFEIQKMGEPPLLYTTEREISLSNEQIALLGLDHPMIKYYLQKYCSLSPTELGIRVKGKEGLSGVLSLWHVVVQGEKREIKSHVITLSTNSRGDRIPQWERNPTSLFFLPPTSSDSEFDNTYLLREILEPMLQRELLYRGILNVEQDYKAELIGWIEVVPS